MKVEKFWQHWSALWATSRQVNKKTLAHGCEFWGFDDGKRHRELLLYHPCDVDDYVSRLCNLTTHRIFCALVEHR